MTPAGLTISVVVAGHRLIVGLGCGVLESRTALVVCWILFVAGLGAMTRLVIPRIAELTFAAERESDPLAAERQRRGRIASWIGLLLNVATGTAALLWSLRH